LDGRNGKGVGFPIVDADIQVRGGVLRASRVGAAQDNGSNPWYSTQLVNKLLKQFTLRFG
jgi:hypothetical protein